MTNRHRTTGNVHTQQSTVESAVLEGEVVTDSSELNIEDSIDDKIAKGRAYSRSKAAGTESDDSAARAAQAINKPSWFARYRGYVLWMLMFIVVILILFVTRPNTAWQIQHINTLQTDVSQLYQDNQTVESRLAALEAKEPVSQKAIETAIKEALADSENRPLVSQADLDELKQSIQQQLLPLQESLHSLKETATVQLEKVQEGAEKLLDSAIEAPQSLALSPAQPSENTEASLKRLEDKLQTKIGELDSKLSELFDFNSHQQALTTQQALSAFQIQQWIVEINTQWLMQGRVEQTTQQLLALEQVIGLSDFPEVTTLARLIGQDLAHLEVLQKKVQRDALVNTQALKAAVSKLSVIDNQVAKANDKLTSKPHLAAIDEKVYIGEEISSESALDQLMARFGQMISLKKRETSTEQTHVESIILQDVLVQRGLLLVDRIDWALQTESVSGLSLATADLQAFIDTHFASQSQEFTHLLEPFKALTFGLRQPLAILAVQTEL